MSETTVETTSDTWYAWSTIDYGAEYDEREPTLIIKRKVIKVGDKVTPSKLKLTEDSDEWKELVESGVVRNYQFPEDLRDNNTSPQKIVSARIAAMAEGVDTGTLDATVVAALMARPTNATEGVHELTPEGELTTPENAPPPPATGNTPPTQ